MSPLRHPLCDTNSPFTPHLKSNSYCKMAVLLRNSRISLAICKAIHGLEIDDVMPQITTAVQRLADKKSHFRAALLKNVNASWAAILFVRKVSSSGQGDDDATVLLDQMAELAREVEPVAKMVDYGCFQLSSEAHRDGLSCASLGVGNIVSLRRIFYSDREKRDLLAYSCLALMKSYFHQIKGLVSTTFYEPADHNSDGGMIMGLALWENIQSASAFVDQEIFRRGESYWRDMEVDVLRYEVCRVVYVTSTSSDPR